MTISISISPKAEARLREKAAATGQPIETYVSRLVERAADSEDVDKLLTPFRDEISASGMTDKQFDDFFEDLREKAFQERQRRPA